MCPEIQTGKAEKLVEKIEKLAVNVSDSIQVTPQIFFHLIDFIGVLLFSFFFFNVFCSGLGFLFQITPNNGFTKSIGQFPFYKRGEQRKKFKIKIVRVAFCVNLT